MKNIPGFLLTLALSIAYTLMIDANSGVVFISVIIAAPVVSILMTLWIKQRLEFSVSVSSTLVNKNEILTFRVTFKKNSIIPVPFIQLRIFSSCHFSVPEYDTFRISLSSKEPETISVELTSVVRGKGYAGISELIITDYLGLVSFDCLKNETHGKNDRAVEIFPNVPEIPADNILLREMCDAVAYDDNEETEDQSVSAGGMPGYEHREYEPGDSIKRINWKLSSKRDFLFVRLDEKPKITSLNIVLDFKREYDFGDELLKLRNEERIIEGALALLRLIAGLSLECCFFYLTAGGWAVKKIETAADIDELRYLMAGYEFKDKSADKNRIPKTFIEEASKLSSLMIFSSAPDKELSKGAEELYSSGVLTSIILSDSGEKLSGAWYITDDYDFKKL